MLVCQHTSDTDIATIMLAWPRGAALEPSEAQGLTSFSAALAKRGTADKSREQMQQAFDAIAASLSLSVHMTRVTAELSVLNDYLSQAFGLLKDVLHKPAFDQAESERLRQERLAWLKEASDDDSWLTTRLVQCHLWPAHPFSRAVHGNLSTIHGLKAEDAQLTWEHLASEPFAFGISSQLSSDDVQNLYQDLDPSTPLKRPDHAIEEPYKPRNLFVERADKSQATLSFAQPAPASTSESGIRFRLIEAIFGGMFTSRLNSELRVKQGLTYGAGFHLWRGDIPWWSTIDFSCDADDAEHAAAVCRSMLSDLSENGLSKDELQTAKQYCTGSFRLANTSGLDRLHNDMMKYLSSPSLSDDDILRLWETATLEDVNQLAQTYCHPDNLSTVLCAPSKPASFSHFEDKELPDLI